MNVVYAFTIGEEHVGAVRVKVGGRTFMTVNFMGRILPGDIGKRVYLNGDILQVENDGQRAARLAR